MFRANKTLNELFNKNTQFKIADDAKDYEKEIFNKRDEIVNFLENLENMTNLEQLEKMADLIVRFERIYTVSNGGPFFIYPTPISDNYVRVCKRIHKLTANYSDHIVQIDKNRILNGYELYDYYCYCDSNPVTYNYFLKLCKIWKNLMEYKDDEWVEKSEPLEELTEKEFFELFDKTACRDWGKQDEHGECFGGFWKYPDNSDEKEHAYELSIDKNKRLLWKLPYPKRFLIETINIGCNNRYESVKYSNYLGYWMEEKMKFMNVD